MLACRVVRCGPQQQEVKMHSLIGLIVYASCRNEALKEAKERLDRLCGEDGQPFHYGSTMDHQYARWQTRPVVMRCDGKRGKVFLKRMMKATKRSFMYNLDLLRKQLEEFTDDELYNQRYGNEIDRVGLRHRAWATGSYKGGEIHLYDDETEGIHEQGHLDDVLDKWSCMDKPSRPNPYTDLNVYVVPCDVHY
jgi:hypothetical protein